MSRISYVQPIKRNVYFIHKESKSFFFNNAYAYSYIMYIKWRVLEGVYIYIYIYIYNKEKQQRNNNIEKIREIKSRIYYVLRDLMLVCNNNNK